MRRKTYWHRLMWRLAIALILAAYLWLLSPLPATAQNVAEYFQISYDPVTFSKNEIRGSESMDATIRGSATCTKDLPVPITEASFTSRILAEHTESQTSVTLNSSYTVTIKPFPSKNGDTAEISQVVPLQFPAQAESGNYNVIGKPIEAKIKIGFGWVDVTSYLPQDQLMGSLNYIASESTPVPVPAPAPAPTPAPTPPPEHGMAWWAWLIVAVAAATTIVNVIWFLRHRTT